MVKGLTRGEFKDLMLAGVTKELTEARARVTRLRKVVQVLKNNGTTRSNGKAGHKEAETGKARSSTWMKRYWAKQRRLAKQGLPSRIKLTSADA